MFFNVLVSWIIMLGCIYVTYAGVKELAGSVIQRPLSLLLTLLLVTLGAGLLNLTIDTFTGDWLAQAYGYGGYLDNRVYSVIAIALWAGSAALIYRDTRLGLAQASCPRCGAPLLGRIACPGCAWGKLPIPAVMTGMLARTSMQAPRPAGGAPTMMALGAVPAPAAPGGAGAGFCMMCGSGMGQGQTFCAKCGTPAGAAST